MNPKLHVISTQKQIYQTYVGEDDVCTVVSCTCGLKLDEIPSDEVDGDVARGHNIRVTAAKLKHQIDVIAKELGLEFREQELPRLVHPE
ncbi:MAG: hypothetical protein WA239_07425 [Candidatus Sulfotelmatobacter sp.]